MADGYFLVCGKHLRFCESGMSEFDYNHKEDFNFISVIRLPDFVTKEEFEWAIEEATRKKKSDFSKVEFLLMTKEYACSVCILALFDDEPQTVA